MMNCHQLKPNYHGKCYPQKNILLQKPNEMILDHNTIYKKKIKLTLKWIKGMDIKVSKRINEANNICSEN